MKAPKCLAIGLVLLSMLLVTLPIVSGATGGNSLDFTPNKYADKTLTVNGQTINYRAFENIVYVKNPVDAKYQVMNIYVPQEYYEGKSIDNYTAETAPVFLPNMVGGYMPGLPGVPGPDRETGSPNAVFLALSKGYVVAAPGVRGRTTQDENGQYTGKAPAAIVDLKAAVRYLRHNDKLMPGDAEKIISNGTSAGGALSSLLGATGNHKDYEPYLKAIGAADERDDIFAVSAYCPITNLENADMAYEWQFHGINQYSKMVAGIRPPRELSAPPENQGAMPLQRPNSPQMKGTMSAGQIRYSGELKAMFPAYINGLGLKQSDGTALTLDEQGNGSFKEYVKSFVIASAQKALKSGKDLSALNWLTIIDGTVTDIDFDKYMAYATRAKQTPAFDGLDLSNPENDEFGAVAVKAQHFTQFGKEHSTVGGSLADAGVVKMMNSMNYIGSEGIATAKHWRIRHGNVDRDTSLAIPVILATKLINNGVEVDFAMPWEQPHGGDYDLDELFGWIGRVCDSSAAKTSTATVPANSSDPANGKVILFVLLGLGIVAVLFRSKLRARK